MTAPAWTDRLPRYHALRPVRAAPIAAFVDITAEGDEVLRLALGPERSVKVVVPAAVFDDGRAKIGDYLIVDDEGEVSWMPAGAFALDHRREP